MKRNILLNPGPATTTDTVKQAQVVPDICPREKEFGLVMAEVEQLLLKIVHADPNDYAAVLFCGSGTLNMDVCINSLLPKDKKILVVNNGSYSSRAVDICKAYSLNYIDLNLPIEKSVDVDAVKKILDENSDVAVVYATHHETGTGVLNPIRNIGKVAHEHNSIFIVDTTSTLAMRPINVYDENIDFCMASAQKGIQAMAGLSFIIGRKNIIEDSSHYPMRSYYCNLFAQYDYFRKNGQMQFTPPVQTIYSARQALKEYFIEGELNKWARHQRVINAIHSGLKDLGFKETIPSEYQSDLVVAVKYPDDINWDFEKVHDYCYNEGFTIYPGKMQGKNTFRLCSLGAIDEDDIKKFFEVLRSALIATKVAIPIKYNK